MQQLDQPYRDQQLGNGKPHRSEKPNPANPVKPKQAKPKQAKPNVKKAKKAKKAQTPPVPPATEEQTQADNIAITTFLSQDPDRLWHGTKLRAAIQELCSLSNQQVASAIMYFRQTGHLVIEREVEVDGEKLDGAYKFVSNPQPEIPREKKAAEQVKKAEQVKREKKEKVIALEKAQKAAAAKLVATAFQELQVILENGDHITSTELQAKGISLNRQKKIRELDDYKESGIQCKELPDETFEYWIEPTS